jgi:hypothetical protein
MTDAQIDLLLSLAYAAIRAGSPAQQAQIREALDRVLAEIVPPV